MTYNPPHILVVDDDSLIRQTLKLYLEATGYRVSLAANGLQAIASLEYDRPDVIILDIFMPEMDGFETLRRMNHAAHRARVLAISGGGSSAHCDFLQLASRYGADSVLKKPFTAVQLVGAVDALIMAQAVPQCQVSR